MTQPQHMHDDGGIFTSDIYRKYDWPDGYMTPPDASGNPPGFPQRSTCRWCRRVIERTSATGDWTSAKLAGVSGRDRERPQAAPNPADGPMPGHEPGTAIVSPPASS